MLRVLDSIAHKLCNMRVLWFSDNQNVVGILKVGSRQPHLHEKACGGKHTLLLFESIELDRKKRSRLLLL